MSLVGSRFGQAVVVRPAGGVKATVEAWQRVGDVLNKVGGPFAATIGRNGFVSAGEKLEGDGCTPRGVYALGLVFGYESSMATAMPYRQIGPRDCWVDDPESPDYNRWVTHQPDGVSAERMQRDDGLYRYGIVVEYNTMPVVAGKGSAIFVHLWRGPEEATAGCVAMAEESLLWLLGWLKSEERPVIVLDSEYEIFE